MAEVESNATTTTTNTTISTTNTTTTTTTTDADTTTTTTNEPTIDNLDAKLNGLNGVSEDDEEEPMDVDSQVDSQNDSQDDLQEEDSQASSDEPATKKCETNVSASSATELSTEEEENVTKAVEDEMSEKNNVEESKKTENEAVTAEGGDESDDAVEMVASSTTDKPQENGAEKDKASKAAEDEEEDDEDEEEEEDEDEEKSTVKDVSQSKIADAEDLTVAGKTETCSNDSNSDAKAEAVAITAVEKESPKKVENEVKDDEKVVTQSGKAADSSLIITTTTATTTKTPPTTITATISAVSSASSDALNGDSADDDVQHVPIINEVHSISDSDDDEEQTSAATITTTTTNKSIITKTAQGNSKGNVKPLTQQNGHRQGNNAADDDDDDDDAPVSIHSDSEPEMTITSTKNGSNTEIHEILSDKEDCVLVEDDKKDDFISPRRSTRARKSVVKVRDFSAFDDDIEEVVDDPLTQPAAKRQKTSTGIPPLGITIQDARSLAATDPLLTPNNQFPQPFLQTNTNNNNKKEPTLVIIDTNQILQKNIGPSVTSQPFGHAANIRASITPITKPTTTTMQTTKISPGLTPLSNQSSTPLLPALTDDMFVLEAPSFIVPYIYEKPPSKNLKEIVEKIGKDLEEQRKKEGDEGKDKSADGATSAEATGTGDASDQQKADLKLESKDDKKKKKKRRANDGDDSWDESDTSTDDEASDTEQRTKVLIKEAKDDLDMIKPHIISAESLKDATAAQTGAVKKDNYFESPLGLFFMDIGINLVQEHVQTDLLRQQKKKLARESDSAAPSIKLAINSLMKNLELSKQKNEGFKFETKRCEYCNYKSESVLAMAHHYETPHMHNHQYRCNFCSFEARPPYDILFHMEAVHNIKARLEKTQSYHQCPNCPFEDNGKSKLARHSVICQKKFRPEINLSPPVDWEPPAKIPRIKPRHGLVGTATAYQAMAAQAQRAASSANIIQRQNAVVNAAIMRGRGRPQTVTKTSPAGTVLRANQSTIRPQIPGMILPNNFQINSPGQFIQVAGTGLTMLQSTNKSLNIQNAGPKTTQNKTQQPSISITPLPRHGVTNANALQTANALISANKATGGVGNMKTGQTSISASNSNNNSGGGGSSSGNNTAGGSGNQKTSFVICEICDGYIKDLDQLRNHMQWMHKVKIHPKMIYNRPPLNCQKCQFRFFTDQGLERHLLGSHGLVTSSMQEAANKGKDAGRCPVCGRMYQWKLLNHVSRDHSMTLKPAHLSYKCTVCTATFGMYKQFENHVYSAHSTVAKKAMDNKKSTTASSSGGSGIGNSGGGGGSSSKSNLNSSGDSLLKPLKINDEITIIPQPASRQSRPMEIESHVID